MGPLGYVLVHIGTSLNPRKSWASHPGGLTLSRERLLRCAPTLFLRPGSIASWASWLFGMMLARRSALKFHCRYGDARAAVVVSENPLIISAYSDEFDGVKLLEFPQYLASELGLKRKSTLVTINTYSDQGSCRGIFPPVRAPYRSFRDFFPVIGEMVSGDIARLEQLRSEIHQSEFEAAYRLGKECLAKRPGFVQNGLPYLDSLSDAMHPGSAPITDEVRSSSVTPPAPTRGQGALDPSRRPKRVRAAEREQMPHNWRVALPVFFVGAFCVAYAIRLIVNPHDPSVDASRRVRASTAFFNWLHATVGHGGVVSGLLLLGLILVVGSYMILKNKIVDPDT